MPMYALHKNADGTVLSAKSWDMDYELTGWIRDSDIRGGDRIEFGEATKREPLPVEREPGAVEEPPEQAGLVTTTDNDLTF